MTDDLFSDFSPQPEAVVFEPTRDAGLKRMGAFISRTGTYYASQRNYDFGPMHRSSVSALSPWIRHRLITEEEVLTHALARHSPSAAMKFIQEVFWRGYFKGWLEKHPSVWSSYQNGLQTARNALEANTARNTDYLDAINGRTGIACFDHWCRELRMTGYLHNHARMWFASIWIFTLRLHWELGADFFMHHLLDGDPASNTLSWRWVGGLHTKGKTYLARPSNIAKYTNGQFEPSNQLATIAEPLIESAEHPLVSISVPEPSPKERHVLLITSEDCCPETVCAGDHASVLGLVASTAYQQSDQVRNFQKRAVEDAMMRSHATGSVRAEESNWSEAIIEAADRAGTKHVVTPLAPIGPVATRLEAARRGLEQAGIHLHQERRTYDTLTWSHADKGFFNLKKKIRAILRDLGLSDT